MSEEQPFRFDVGDRVRHTRIRHGNGKGIITRRWRYATHLETRNTYDIHFEKDDYTSPGWFEENLEPIGPHESLRTLWSPTHA